MSQPIHRYSNERVIDGGVFSYAQGTNPEILLLLELVKSDDDASWHYALARMTGYPVEVHDGDEVIWSPGSGGNGAFDRPYFNLLIGRVPGSPE